MAARRSLRPVVPQASTLWDFPRQGVDGMRLGNPGFGGVTPAMVVANVLERYTKPGDLVVDPMAGSGTTMDVARAMRRRVLAFDLAPTRPDILASDARTLPLPDGYVDLCFVDPPYGDNLRYSGDPRCLGRIPADDARYYQAVDMVAREASRVLRPEGTLAWVVSDQYRRREFTPVGFRSYGRLLRYFSPVDVVCLVRRNDRSGGPMWEHRARERGFYLRGFKYLFLMRKGSAA